LREQPLRLFDEQLRFRPGDEHIRRDAKIEAEEFLFAQQIGHGFALPSTLHQGGEGGKACGGGLVLGVQNESQAREAKGACGKQFGGKAWCVNAPGLQRARGVHNGLGQGGRGAGVVRGGRRRSAHGPQDPEACCFKASVW